MRADIISSLSWMKRQLELSPGEEAQEMATLTAEVLDYFGDMGISDEAPIAVCYLTIPEAEESEKIDDNTAFVVYLGKTEADNDLTMIWEPADGLHLQEVYRDKLKGETIIPREKAVSLLKALRFILPEESEAGAAGA